MKKIITIYIRFLQQILLFVLLFLVYFVLVGLTKIFLFFLKPKLLGDGPGFFQKPELQTNFIKPY